MEYPCLECDDVYPKDDLTDGLCADCRANFEELDLEDKLEKALGW